MPDAHTHTHASSVDRLLRPAEPLKVSDKDLLCREPTTSLHLRLSRTRLHTRLGTVLKLSANMLTFLPITQRRHFNYVIAEDLIVPFHANFDPKSGCKSVTSRQYLNRIY